MEKKPTKDFIDGNFSNADCGVRNAEYGRIFMNIIDSHLHIQPLKLLKPAVLARMTQDRKDADQLRSFIESPTAFVKHLDHSGVSKAVVVNYPSPDVMGFTNEVNDFVQKYCAEFPDRLIPCGAIHPRFSRQPEKEMAKLLKKQKIKVVKIHPPHQLYQANAYRTGLKALGVMYRWAEQEGVPVIIHTGTSIFPGARNVYADPLPIDDVALDFPKLKIIIAHGGRPLWMETCFFLIRRHKNCYLDLSGIPPKNILKYFPRIAEIADRTMFGSDWPGPMIKSIKANVDAVATLPLDPETKEKILFKTAQFVFQ